MTAKIMAIDPGDVESGYVIWNGEKIEEFDKVENDTLLTLFPRKQVSLVVIEQVASYGMAVGKNVFETVFWTGRFYQEAIKYTFVRRVLRKDVKMHICGSNQAKDSNIVTALVDRFGDRQQYGQYGKGTKKNPGFFYGFYKDIWQAFALAVHCKDNL